MLSSDPNLRAFHVNCSLCKEPRSKMGTGIPDRQKRLGFVDYRWCVKCDRAS